MAEYWQTMHLRGQQTIGVCGTFAPALQVGPLTLTAHTTDVALILTHVDERNVQQDVFDDAMLGCDANFDLIHDIAVRVPQLLAFPGRYEGLVVLLQSFASRFE
jgi:hypothetical protein